MQCVSTSGSTTPVPLPTVREEGEVFEGGKKKSVGVATHRKGEIGAPTRRANKKMQRGFLALALKLGKRGDRVSSEEGGGKWGKRRWNGRGNESALFFLGYFFFMTEGKGGDDDHNFTK